MMNKPLESLEIKTISYRPGWYLDSLRFTAADGSNSPKYGDKFPLAKHLDVRVEKLTNITVFKSTGYIVGLRLTYANHESDEVIGTNPDIAEGDTQGINFAVEDGEKLVGIMIEQDVKHPRRLGFIFMRLN